MYAIGIDLGTTNSVVSVFRNHDKESLKIDGHNRFLPSVVSFRKGQTPLIGHAAKARLLVDPESTVASAKRFMGDRGKVYQIHGKTYTPVDIAALILEQAAASASQALGQKVNDAVITVPAYFDDAQRADTLRAGEQAGLNVIRLSPEPSAAAVSYGFNQSKDQTLMVYDLGGGTFDISVLRVAGNDFDVLAVGGDSRLGGDDFDEAILAWAAKAFREEHGVDLLDGSRPEYNLARQRLKEEAERAKIELSASDTAEIIIPELVGRSVELELHVDQFNAMIEPMLKRTLELMQQTLRDAGLTADDIDRIVLVGGSTLIPAVRQMIAAGFREPYCDQNPNEAVAWGASIIAAAQQTPELDLTPVRVSDVTAHSLGIGMWDERHTRFDFVPLVSKNSKYPCMGGVLGFTIDAFQSDVQIRVFRGEEVLAEDNEELGDLNVPIKQPVAEHVPVAALFNLDNNGVLHFTAVDIPGSSQNRATVTEFLNNAFINGNRISTEALQHLIGSGDLPQPESISIEAVLN